MPKSPEQAPVGRGEKILANATAALAVIAFVCLVSVLVAPLFGVDFATTASWYWPAALLVAWWGFPIALIGVAAVIITRIIANRRHK
ncbi:hypothetical protein [Gulosibacter faecalis]|uniref:Uncharacterized protein n=1 Tax=Gulosibacter faecalis TaxID=272240 RepID=A0ABW5UVK7_9MICO|nr:hypothetical protein [Gulosibacter faecalis]